jgi:hypothetical protein
MSNQPVTLSAIQIVHVTGGVDKQTPRPFGDRKVIAPDITLGAGRCILEEAGFKVPKNPNQITGELPCSTLKKVGKLLAKGRR